MLYTEAFSFWVADTISRVDYSCQDLVSVGIVRISSRNLVSVTDESLVADNRKASPLVTSPVLTWATVVGLRGLTFAGALPVFSALVGFWACVRTEPTSRGLSLRAKVIPV